MHRNKGCPRICDNKNNDNNNNDKNNNNNDDNSNNNSNDSNDNNSNSNSKSALENFCPFLIDSNAQMADANWRTADGEATGEQNGRYSDTQTRPSPNFCLQNDKS